MTQTSTTPITHAVIDADLGTLAEKVRATNAQALTWKGAGKTKAFDRRYDAIAAYAEALRTHRGLHVRADMSDVLGIALGSTTVAAVNQRLASLDAEAAAAAPAPARNTFAAADAQVTEGNSVFHTMVIDFTDDNPSRVATVVIGQYGARQLLDQLAAALGVTVS